MSEPYAVAEGGAMWSLVVCDSCGSCRKSGSFAGNYFPAIDWTMCSTCQDKGYLSDWPDAGSAMPAISNYFE